jgi:hypothetical protein
MTIVRVPAAQATDYARRAYEDDESVVGGLLAVDVQPWSVRMAGSTPISGI